MVTFAVHGPFVTTSFSARQRAGGDAMTAQTVVLQRSGTMDMANVTNVAVTCAAQGAETSSAQRGPMGASGTMATGTGQGGVIVNPTTRAITGGITSPGCPVLRLAEEAERTFTGPMGTIAVGLTMASDNVTGMVLNNIALSPADYASCSGDAVFNVHTWRILVGRYAADQRYRGRCRQPRAARQHAEVPASQSTATGNGTVMSGRGANDALTQNHTV